MIGKTISHYKILEKLGEGGMGVVYKAHDTKLDRTVTLKFLSPLALDRDSDKTRFVHEAKAAAALHHPNICTIHEIDEHEGQLFIAMAYVERENLRERLAAGPLAINEAIDIVMQIASGLHAAHEKGIVHRDVKPANIMLDASGRALLMDFGLAQRKDATRLTRTGMTAGTMAYMSPEQLSGGDVDLRADVWSLGVVLYELLTNRLPFRGEVEPALMYSIMNETPESVVAHRPDAPSGLDGVIARALDKNPEHRYQNVESLRADLEELRNDPEALPAGVPVRRIRRRKRLTLVVGAVLIAAAAASPFVIPRLVGESQTVRSLAVLAVSNLSGDPEQDAYAAGMHVELISTLGKIDNLVVLGRRSVLKYADSKMSPQEIAAELGVDALMEGSVSFVGDRIQVAAELVKASTGQILWTDSFDGKLSDAVDIRHRIALAVADGIHARLTPELQQRRTSQVNPEAYRLYLKFQANWTSSEALATIKEVVEIDSTFAEAWAALSARASYSAQYGHVPKDEGYQLARIGAEKAIALDPTLAAGHMAMAGVYWHQDWDWERSLEETERAAALNPMGTDVRNSQAQRLFLTGRVEEGIELYEKIIATDPLNPDLRQRLGWHLGNIGRFELAIEHLERNLELFPDHYFSNMLLALSYAALGEYEEAVAVRKKMEQMYESLRVDADGDGVPEKGIGPRYSQGGGTGLLVKAYANTSARGELVEVMKEAKADYMAEPSGFNAWLVALYLIPLGQADEAREWLALSAKAIRKHVQDSTPRAAEEVFNQACLYSALGDKDQAFEWLDLAFELRAAELVDLFRRQYQFAELWDDPRYEEMMRRRGFPEDVIVSLRR